MTGATGDVVDVTISIRGDRRPQPPHLRLYRPTSRRPAPSAGASAAGSSRQGTFTVTMTVTDANGDTASQDFDWVVTGTAIAPPAGVNVRIDWGEVSFSRSEADVTARIISAIACKRGRSPKHHHLAVARQAGTLTFELDNSDGLYDLENTSSSLHGQIRPGLAVQLRDGGEPDLGGRAGQHPHHLRGQRPA